VYLKEAVRRFSKSSKMSCDRGAGSARQSLAAAVSLPDVESRYGRSPFLPKSPTHPATPSLAKLRRWEQVLSRLIRMTEWRH